MQLSNLFFGLAMNYLFDDIRDWIYEKGLVLSKHFQRSRKKWAREALSMKVTILIAALSALAAGYSYKASQSSADTAERSQQLSEQISAAQILLARPRIVVLGGEAITIPKGKDIHGTDKYEYAVEIRIKNAGERIASPVWVFVQRGTAVKGEPKKISAMPKDTEFVVRFSMDGHGSDGSFSQRTPWLVGTVAGDDIPNLSPTTGNAPPKDRLIHKCQPVEMVTMESKENASNLERPFLLSHGFAVPSTIADIYTGKPVSTNAITSTLANKLIGSTECQ